MITWTDQCHSSGANGVTQIYISWSSLSLNIAQQLKPCGTGASKRTWWGLCKLLPHRAAPFTPWAGGYTSVSSQSLSGTLHLEYTPVNMLIFSSLDGLIPWVRLRHAWALASWGSIKRSDMVNWEKKPTKQVAITFVPLLFLTQVGNHESCQMCVCCVGSVLTPLPALVTHFRYLRVFWLFRFQLPPVQSSHSVWGTTSHRPNSGPEH